MKQSNLDLVFQRYICGETCKYEKIKIEAFLKEIEAKDIHFLSEDTEELFFRKITNARISSDEIRMLFRNLSKLKVPGLNWLRLEAFEVYYYNHPSRRKRDNGADYLVPFDFNGTNKSHISTSSNIAIRFNNLKDG